MTTEQYCAYICSCCAWFKALVEAISERRVVFAVSSRQQVRDIHVTY